MQKPVPTVPEDLHPLAREILEELRGKPDAAAITLGGGTALQHYLNVRPTADLDAWWTSDATVAARREIETAVTRVAVRNSGTMRVRSWGETESYEIVGGAGKLFAFQIARRDVQLDAPVPSAWPPVLIETLRDNLGGKMNALVQRGAPRDFVDVFNICINGLAAPDECWLVWTKKNPAASRPAAQTVVLERLSMLEARRPLAAIAGELERQAASRLRDWVKQSLCREWPDDSRPGR